MRTNLSKFSLIIFLTLSCVLASSAQERDNYNKTHENDKEQSESKNCPEYGVARLKVTFDKSGKITKVEIVSSAGCKYFDERALKAVKEIKIEPAKKNGKKITQVKIVEYTFTINEQRSPLEGVS